MTTAPAPLQDNDDALLEKLKGLERFIARRFDEISMEINATAQQLDMAEGGIAGKFSEVLTVLAAVSHQGATTQANTGLELESVINETDAAANSIMDSATRIGALLDAPETLDKGRISAIKAELDTIMMACSFQDLTGQRIRKALNNIQSVEETLSGTLEKMGIEVENRVNEAISEESRTSSQDDIDALFK